MTQSAHMNNDGFTANNSDCDQSAVKSNSASSKTEIKIPDEIPEPLKQTFEKISNLQTDLLEEYALIQLAKEQGFPLDTYRRLYESYLHGNLHKLPKKLSLRWSKRVINISKLAAIGSATFPILWASIHYVITIPDRQVQAHEQAWQVIDSAKGIKANGGRIEALESLVKDNVSLARFEAPDAFLAKDPSFLEDLSKKKNISEELKAVRGKGIDLEGVNLVKANLYNAFLVDADFSPRKPPLFLKCWFTFLSRFSKVSPVSNPYKSNLMKINLEEANLRNAIFYDTDLTEATLTNADLRNADLRNAKLKNANLTHANLMGANLTDANLMGAKLKNVIYDNKTLLSDKAKQQLKNSKALYIGPNEKSQLKDAYLRETDLVHADLTNTDLTNVNLSGAFLINANFRGANLSRANLTNTNLTDADLTGTNLKGTQLTDAKLIGAKYNNKTQFPKGFDPNKVGMQKASR